MVTPLLAVDTSGSVVSIAICRGGETLANLSVAHGLELSQRITGMLDEVHETAGVSPEAISAYAVGTGPGSFTGVRIGLATVLALAFARGLPVLGVTSFEALAWEACDYSGPVVPIVRARPGTVYATVFDPQPHEHDKLNTYLEWEELALSHHVARYGCRVMVIGSTAESVATRACAECSNSAQWVRVECPRAVAVAAIAERKGVRTNTGGWQAVTATYVAAPPIHGQRVE